MVAAIRTWASHLHTTLAVSHMPGESVTLSADALSWYHMGQCFPDIVQHLVDTGVTIISPTPHPFQSSDDL